MLNVEFSSASNGVIFDEERKGSSTKMEEWVVVQYCDLGKSIRISM
jgi:hypothetical protein